MLKDPVTKGNMCLIVLMLNGIFCSMQFINGMTGEGPQLTAIERMTVTWKQFGDNIDILMNINEL